jgi:uncharacterized short protein YbdD (DUF466 family)
MNRVCIALGLRDCVVLEDYKQKFGGENLSFHKIYQIFNNLPEKDQKKLADAAVEVEQYVDLKEHYRIFVTDTLYSAYVQAMKKLQDRKAGKSEAQFLTEAVDQKYDSILSEWPMVERAVGKDATLLNRLLNMAHKDWTKEVLSLV